MVELVEYALAVMASTLLISGSVAVYSSFTAYEEGLQLRGTFNAVAGVAGAAIENGSATSRLLLPDSTIGCQGGNLYVTLGSETISQNVAAACSFQTGVASGTHRVSFSEASGQLRMAVS